MKIYRSVLASCVLIAGCDPVSGVSTDAELKTPVDYECIDRTIRKVEGVGSVSLRDHASESFEILPNYGKVITINHSWGYGPDQAASLQIIDSGARVSYSNGMMAMGPPLPAAQLDAFVPLMNRVNAAMTKNCGLPINVRAKIKRS